MIGRSAQNDEEDWCVGCGWDQYGEYEQHQALKYHAKEDATAVNLQQVFCDSLSFRLAINHHTLIDCYIELYQVLYHSLGNTIDVFTVPQLHFKAFRFVDFLIK